MARKTRSDARLPKLTKEQKEVLLGWLDEQNLGVREVVGLLHDTYGIKTSKSSLSSWYQSYLFSADVRAAADLAGHLEETLRDLPLNLDDELISRAAQAKFESEVAKSGDLKGHVELRKLRQKDAAQKLAERSLSSAESGFKLKYEQKERELALQREKFKRDTCELFLTWCNDERAKAITASGASNAEKIEQLGRAMFGEDWNE